MNLTSMNYSKGAMAWPIY